MRECSSRKTHVLCTRPELSSSGLVAVTACALWLTVRQLNAPGPGEPGARPVGPARQEAPTPRPMPEMRSVRIRAIGDVMTPANLNGVYGMDVRAWMGELLSQWR